VDGTLEKAPQGNKPASWMEIEVVDGKESPVVTVSWWRRLPRGRASCWNDCPDEGLLAVHRSLRNITRSRIKRWATFRWPAP